MNVSSGSFLGVVGGLLKYDTTLVLLTSHQFEGPFEGLRLDVSVDWNKWRCLRKNAEFANISIGWKELNDDLNGLPSWMVVAWVGKGIKTLGAAGCVKYICVAGVSKHFVAM